MDSYCQAHRKGWSHRNSLGLGSPCLVLREGSKHRSKNQTASNPSWEEKFPHYLGKYLAEFDGYGRSSLYSSIPQHSGQEGLIYFGSESDRGWEVSKKLPSKDQWKTRERYWDPRPSVQRKQGTEMTGEHHALHSLSSLCTRHFSEHPECIAHLTPE